MVNSAIHKAAVYRSASGWNDPQRPFPIDGFTAFSGIVPGKAGNSSASGFVNSAVTSLHHDNSIQWRIYGHEGHAPPWGSKFFQFHAVFGNIWQNRILAGAAWRVGASISGKSSIRHWYLFKSFVVIVEKT